MEDKNWMGLPSYCCSQYLRGLKSFMEIVRADMEARSKTTVYCPCHDCRNDKQYSDFEVAGELCNRDSWRYWRMYWRCLPATSGWDGKIKRNQLFLESARAGRLWNAVEIQTWCCRLYGAKAKLWKSTCAKNSLLVFLPNEKCKAWF